ncbi:MAG: hypothetical protein K2G93_05630 [Rikenella sp.]|nr:hypothetical protein [Rikenella sp.]
MKAKHFLVAFLLLCAPLAFLFGQAYGQDVEKDETTLARNTTQKIMYVQMNGLQSGNVSIRVTNDGKTYYFMGSGSGVSGDVSLGSFPFTGTYCDVEITLNNVSPRFRRFSGAAFLQFDSPESQSTRVTWPTKPGGLIDPNDTAGIVAVFY